MRHYNLNLSVRSAEQHDPTEVEDIIRDAFRARFSRFVLSGLFFDSVHCATMLDAPEGPKFSIKVDGAELSLRDRGWAILSEPGQTVILSGPFSDLATGQEIYELLCKGHLKLGGSLEPGR